MQQGVINTIVARSLQVLQGQLSCVFKANEMRNVVLCLGVWDCSGGSALPSRGNKEGADSCNVHCNHSHLRLANVPEAEAVVVVQCRPFAESSAGTP